MEERRILHMTLSWLHRAIAGSQLQPVILITDSELVLIKSYYRIPNETMLEFRVRVSKEVYMEDFKDDDVFDHNVLPGVDPHGL